ncbi:ester cyclase [Salinigranum sp.]|uniref:ester cyclase n=1 Tax=Salinigranum sp. TaxID=1966351 RepID=UPI00356594B8
MMTAAQEVEQEYRELWNGDFSKLEVVAESVDVYVPSLSDGEIHGRDAFEAYLRDLRTGFPDWHVTVDDILTSDGMVMKEWTVTATHEGEYNGIPPTNREMEISGMAKIRTENGKVVEDRLYYDLQEVFDQLGLTEE